MSSALHCLEQLLAALTNARSPSRLTTERLNVSRTPKTTSTSRSSSRPSLKKLSPRMALMCYSIGR